MLVVEADSSGTALPSVWTLEWVSDSSGVRAVAQDSILACLGDTARVDTIQGPMTAADSAANLTTAHFCSAGSPPASVAYYLLDLTAGSRGKLKVVALSADSSVIGSNEVTYNGGVDGDYQPVILSATSAHHHGNLTVTVQGAGLHAVQGLSVQATDGSWTFPLNLVSGSDTAVVAQGALAAPLPLCSVEATIAGSRVATASLAADSFPPLEPEGGGSYFTASLDTAGMLAKDFAFVDAGDQWHIFYTREYQTGYTGYENQRLIGHAISTDRNLNTWTVITTLCDTCSVHARGGRVWDNLHVWAPSVIRKPGDITYYMFYTGVQLDTVSLSPSLTTSQIQRLGVATSTDLIHWTQDPSPLYWNKKVSWTYQDSSSGITQADTSGFYSDAWQFRDPFVMADPESLGQYLLYFATIDSCALIAGSSGCASQAVIGVARTPAVDPGNLRSWADAGPLLRTSQSHMAASRDESPVVLFRSGKYWLLYTATHQYGDQLAFLLGPHPASPDTGQWSAPDSLKSITCDEHPFPSTLNQWHAPETLWFNSQEYLMAYSDDLFQGGRIQFAQIKPPDSTCPTDSFQLVAPDMLVGVGRKSTRAMAPLGLTLVEPSPVHSIARLRLALAEPAVVHVAVYDILGRHVRTLLNGPVAAGSRILRWDARGEHGAEVGSGMYFVRATCSAGRQVMRIPLIR
ncbi:MAG TPA: hypothetical protein VFK69_03200 [Candidatus Eisenbacteria bacterium]|nr:hypothetical protein [Candidatus Eisenbacteria bacterium]